MTFGHRMRSNLAGPAIVAVLLALLYADGDEAPIGHYWDNVVATSGLGSTR